MVEFLVGFRYLLPVRGQGTVSFMTGAAILGIAIGVAALIIVMSVLNGYQRDVLSQQMVTNSHVFVKGRQGLTADWKPLMAELAGRPGVSHAAPYLRQPVALFSGGDMQAGYLRGVDPSLERRPAGVKVVSDFSTLVPGKFSVELGAVLAQNLNLKVGDQVSLIIFDGQLTPAGTLPRQKRFTVTRVLKPISGADVDDYFNAYISMADAQLLTRMGEAVTGVALTLKKPLEAPEFAQALADDYPHYKVTDWTTNLAGFLDMFKLQKRVTSLLLSLLVVVATFNLVASLTMTVVARKAEIAILRTMGATPGSIQRMFIIQGSAIGGLGALLGVMCGVPLAWRIGALVHGLEKLTGQALISKSLLMSTFLPSEVRPPEVLAVCAGAFALTVLATLYPSWQASRVAPAEALR